MLGLLDGATSGQGRRGRRGIEEHQGAAVQTEAAEITGELFEPREERIGMVPAPDFDLDRPAVHSARRRPTDAQIDAAAAYAELPVDEAAAVDLWRKRRGRLG
jgi:hypothetical protein